MQGRAERKPWAVILAGGEGTRLQELTRQITGSPIPKQYCRIMGERSMLETTLIRTQRYTPVDNTLVIINSTHLDIAREQLRPLPNRNILVQPCNRDTGPGLLFGLLALAHRDPAAIVGVFPSDHYVGDDRGFIDHVTQATRVVEQMPGKIVILGIRPDHPEPGYGYIMPAGQLASLAERSPTFHVERFHEKPPVHVARNLLRQGGLWNSFVMVFQIRRMLELIRTVMPEEFDRVWAVTDDPVKLRDVYHDLKPWNLSRDFLERIPEHLVVQRVDDVHWSDWGTRDLIERTLKKLTQKAPWQARRPVITAVAS